MSGKTFMGIPIRNIILSMFLSISALAIIGPSPAFANNIGENGAWQFETMNDKAARAAIEDMRQKKAGGYYAAPIYNTNIARQFNCSVTSLATGNQGTSTAVGNSPSSSGNSAASTGNSARSIQDQGGGAQSGSLASSQRNAGEVASRASGGVSTSVDGNTYQAINTDQTNSGNQASAVTSSNACQFGLLN